MPTNFNSGSGRDGDSAFRARWEKAIKADMDIKTQFDFAGCRVACYGNMDAEEIFVVDPETLAHIGKPQLDVEYPMLRYGINQTSCSFYPNAMISRAVDTQMRDHCGMTGQRDHYDATMLVRVSERPENLVSLGATQRKTPAKPRPSASADVIPLFGPPQ